MPIVRLNNVQTKVYCTNNAKGNIDNQSNVINQTGRIRRIQLCLPIIVTEFTSVTQYPKRFECDLFKPKRRFSHVVDRRTHMRGNW